MTTVRNFIGGELVDSESGATMPLVDPSTGERYGTAPISNGADIDKAYAAAAAAFAEWKRTTPSHRQKALLDFADEVEKAAGDLVEAEGRNTGKPHHVTAAEEIPPMVDQIRFFAGAARVLEGKSAGEYLADHTSWIRREPVGVIGQVAPWNYPMMMAIWKICPAIAAGNTVVIKPSDTTPVTTVMLAELAARHLPAGVLNVVTGDRVTGANLVAHPTPQMVSITGSVAAGKAVAVSAGGHLKRTHLELGGKAPVIVFDDADLDRALDAVVFMIYSLNGERCTSSSRLLVQQGIADKFIEKLAARVQKLKVGHPLDPATEIGPLIHERHLAKVCSYFDVARQDGATIAVGGKAHDGPGGGHYVQPTLVTNASAKMRVAQEEVFGPFLTVIPFQDEADAVEIANGVQYGLTGYVWTGDMGRALRVADALEAGMIWLNSENVRHLPTPFGGMKASGVGRDGGDYSFDFYMETKHVSLARGTHKIQKLGI